MHRKIFLLISLIIFSSVGFAETCPQIKDIKSSTATGWKVYDSEDGTLLSAKRAAQFKKQITQFSLAEWTSEPNPNGAIHCYYRDQNGSDLDAYLAKKNFSPENATKIWYQVSGAMQCAAGVEKCIFSPQN